MSLYPLDTIRSELGDEAAGLYAACLGFIADVATRHKPITESNNHDCGSCGDCDLFQYEDAGVQIDICRETGHVHLCGYGICSFATTADGGRLEFCRASGRVLDAAPMPGDEWDDRVDLSNFLPSHARASAGDESKRKKRKRAHQTANSNKIWTVRGAQYIGMYCPDLVCDDSIAVPIISRAERYICNLLFDQETRRRIHPPAPPPMSTELMEDIHYACQLARRILVHSNAYQYYYKHIRAEFLCLYVLYDWLRKGYQHPPCVDLKPNEWLVKHLPPIESIPKMFRVMGSPISPVGRKKPLEVHDINIVRRAMTDAVVEWNRLTEPELILKEWRPSAIDSVVRVKLAIDDDEYDHDISSVDAMVDAVVTTTTTAPADRGTKTGYIPIKEATDILRRAR